MMSQQIYAKIKKNSKYYGQTKAGARFPVHIEHQGEWEYTVSGNQNNYRLYDVNLFVVSADGRELRIS
ncbi:hypothetical protein PQQ99_20140 [Paraburkholderia sediminicola]|uniref:hypothetical protein n=1 Tax=Paraburkholderia sediminicola TaxID=458836 RepID=UPI0038B99354